MSDYHILDNRPDGNQLRVVFHLPVPNENNAVGLNKRTALIEYLGGPQVSVLPESRLGAGEADALAAGELYELVWQYDTNPGETLLNKRDALDAKFTSFSNGVIAQLEVRLDFWGYGRDVP